MNLRFSIIILNWNNYKETKEAVESCLKLSYKNKKIIIVDNASVDNSHMQLKEDYPNLIHIQTGDNLGYTGGNNVGIKKAIDLKSDFIMILNNDTLIVNYDFIENIIKIFSLSEEIGVVGPVILDRETNERIDNHKNGFFEKAIESDINNMQFVSSDTGFKGTNRVCGCGIIFSRETLEELGGFDESFFMYVEEQDICYRVKRNKKFILKIEDKNIATLLRKNEYKEDKAYIWYYITRNYFYLIKNNFRGLRRMYLYFLSFLSMLKRIFFVRSKNTRIAMIKGFFDFIKNKRGRNT
jgi:GT2 family glycosyltransferase